MTRSKTESVVHAASAIGNVVATLALRVARYGGNVTEALVRLGTGEKKQYGVEYDQIADILTAISITPEGGRVHILRDIPVDEWISWSDAIDRSCPATASSGFLKKLTNQHLQCWQKLP